MKSWPSKTQRIADYTGRLAWFTFMLFFVAVVQAGLFFWQLKYMRDEVARASAAAKTATDQAKAIIQSNSPILVIAEIKLVPHTSWESRDGAADRIGPGDAIPEFCRVLPNIVNIGRNSMRITSFCIERFVSADALQAAPTYRTVDNNWQPWLTPFSGQWFMPSDVVTEVRLTETERGDVQSGKKLSGFMATSPI
jgi:hypothetical protein